MIRAALLCLSPLVVLACRASAGTRIDANSGADVNAEADADVNAKAKQTDSAPSTTRALFEVDREAETPSAPSGAREAMLGARAGLHLKSSAEPVCRCLRVAVGNPKEAVFVWDGPAPLTNPETQFAIALSSEGLPCPSAASDSLGASYRGYELFGSDVVVEVETARLGRPIAQGAVLPKPPPGGRVMVRSTDRASPYGQSVDGNSISCTVWSSR
ncbi:MAG: hypothetical protein ACM3ZE_24375 [Myxococcales bacterium]